MTLDIASDRHAEATAYRAALGAFATGVCVVTTQGERGPMGITVNSFASVSLDPRLVLWCVDKRSERSPTFIQAEHYVVHVLAAEERDRAARFAKGACDLAPHEVERGDHGVPRLPGVLAWFECRADQRIEAGDHVIILGRVASYGARPGRGLTFFHGRFGETGA